MPCGGYRASACNSRREGIPEYSCRSLYSGLPASYHSLSQTLGVTDTRTLTEFEVMNSENYEA